MPCILCIDDNPQYVDLLHTTLVRDGFEVLDANNTQDALSILRDHHIDLILDNVFRLFRADFDLLIEKTSDAALQDIPVAVVVTAYGTLETMIEVISQKGLALQGAIDAPFTPRELVEMVNHLVA